MLLLLVFASSLVTRLFMINELVCIVKVINNCKRWIDEITYCIFEKKIICYQIQVDVKKNFYETTILAARH